MPFTTSDLAAIDKAIASGELSVQFGDRKVLYRSIDELLKARELVISDLNTGSMSTTRCTLASFSKD